MNIGDRVRVNRNYLPSRGCAVNGVVGEGAVGTIVGCYTLYLVELDLLANRSLFYESELNIISSATAEGTPSPAGARKEATMENIFITIDGVTHEFAEVVAPAPAAPAPVLNINRTFVVYDANGDRVDGYKFESRARRNNDARFAGTGYWLGKVYPDDFTWVPA